MSFGQFTDFFNWLNAHPHWVWLIVFATALSESLVIVGLIVPGFLIMIGFGALIATGHLQFWPTVLFAAAGAFCGDSLSYWLGRRYQHKLEKIWPLSRYPHLMNKGETFFARYGTLSIVFGRFFGPLRAIVPAIAGMTNMPRIPFLFANSFSAMAWAPLYLLPGILFGMSIELAKEFAGQLALLLAIVFVFFILAFVIIKSAYTWIAPQTDVLMYRLLIWSRQHPTGGRVSEALVNPQRSEIRALSILGFILLGSIAVYYLLTHWLFDARLFANIDLLIFNTFQASHLPVLDTFFYGFALLGERISIVILYILLLIYFSLTQRLNVVLYCLAAIILPWLTANLLDVSYLQAFIAHPDSITTKWHANSLFFIDVCALAFVSVLLGKNASTLFRGFLFLCIAMICLFIALAQLYFGIQWLSEIVFGLLLGLTWVSILSIAYRCHTQNTRTNPHILFSTGFLVLLVALPFLVANTEHGARIKPVKSVSTEYVMNHSGWLESGWQILPASRHDLTSKNSQPFTLQWYAPRENIINTMRHAGWRNIENKAQDYLNWINNESQIDQLPVLPHVHAGLYSQLHFTRVINNKLMIVRLWQSNYLLHNMATRKSNPASLWFGTATYSIIKRKLHFNYLVSDSDYVTPTVLLHKYLSGIKSISMEIIKSKKTKPFLVLISSDHQE